MPSSTRGTLRPDQVERFADSLRESVGGLGVAFAPADGTAPGWLSADPACPWAADRLDVISDAVGCEGPDLWVPDDRVTTRRLDDGTLAVLAEVHAPDDAFSGTLVVILARHRHSLTFREEACGFRARPR